MEVLPYSPEWSRKQRGEYFSGFVDFSTQYCLFDSISHCGNEKCEGFKMLKRKATVTLIKNKSN